MTVGRGPAASTPLPPRSAVLSLPSPGPRRSGRPCPSGGEEPRADRSALPIWVAVRGRGTNRQVAQTWAPTELTEVGRRPSRAPNAPGPALPLRRGQSRSPVRRVDHFCQRSRAAVSDGSNRLRTASAPPRRKTWTAREVGHPKLVQSATVGGGQRVDPSVVVDAGRSTCLPVRASGSHLVPRPARGLDVLLRAAGEECGGCCLLVCDAG